MKQAAIIGLLTDYGSDSHYLAQLKGVILGINPKAVIIDLTHSVRPYQIIEAAFVLKTSYRYFPSGTIFVVVVDPGVGSARKLICLETYNYIFLGPDNGVLSLIQEEGILREITNRKYFRPEISSTFHGRDILAPVAAYLSRGLNPAKLGQTIPMMEKLLFPKPEVTNYTIKGEVIFTDRFGNLITNVEKKLVNGWDYDKVLVKIKNKTIKGISRTYSDKKPGSLMALFGSSNYLEIAVNQGNAANQLKVRNKLQAPNYKQYIILKKTFSSPEKHLRRGFNGEKS